MTKKLKNHPYCNCKIVIDNPESPNLLEFYSYKTLVIVAVHNCDSDAWYISCSGTYSQTTRKQIVYFLREYFPKIDYYDIKKIAGTQEYIVYEEEAGKVN